MGNSKDIKRGKAPSPLTILMLCAAAAGRCEFDGCNEPLFKDPITLKEFNNSNVAHIIAASPNGPRGNAKLSEEFSDSIDNLMLLCPKCHHLIDSQEKEYPVEKLREMKRKLNCELNTVRRQNNSRYETCCKRRSVFNCRWTKPPTGPVWEK